MPVTPNLKGASRTTIVMAIDFQLSGNSLMGPEIVRVEDPSSIISEWRVRPWSRRTLCDVMTHNPRAVYDAAPFRRLQKCAPVAPRIATDPVAAGPPEKLAASPQPQLCSANPAPILTPKTTANSRTISTTVEDVVSGHEATRVRNRAWRSHRRGSC